MVDQAFRDAAYPEETGESFIFLVDITSTELPAPIYLTDCRYDAPAVTTDTEGAYILTVGGKDYYCCGAALGIIAPGQSDEEPQGRVQVPNVDQRIGQGLDLLHSPATVQITAVLESDPTVIVGGPHGGLKLQNIKGDALIVEGDLLRPNLSSSPWPKQWLRPAKFKSVYLR